MSTNAKVSPAMMRIAASTRESVPSNPKRMGRIVSPAKKRSLRMMLLWMRIEPPASPTIPKMRVRSAMLLPSNVPSPRLGSPWSAETMLMNASGSDETNAMRMKLVTNSVKCRARARWVTALMEYAAVFRSTMQPIIKTITSWYMRG